MIDPSTVNFDALNVPPPTPTPPNNKSSPKRIIIFAITVAALTYTYYRFIKPKLLNDGK